jgi:hypothetical protein
MLRSVRELAAAWAPGLARRVGSVKSRREAAGHAAAVAGALVCWAGVAGAEPAAAPPPPLAPAPATPLGTPAPSDGAIVLEDVALQGETRALRLDPARTRVEALVLFSAADGIGFGGQWRSGMFGLRGTLGYQPRLFVIDSDPADKSFGAFEFAHSVQLNVDALLVGAETETGGSIGYRFNDLLGHGFSIAYQSVFEAWGQRFALSFPVSYFPGATGRVRDRLGVDPDYKINFPFGPGLEFGMGAAWVL